MSCSAAYALAEQSCEVFVNAHKGTLPMPRWSPDHALGDSVTSSYSPKGLVVWTSRKSTCRILHNSVGYKGV